MALVITLRQDCNLSNARFVGGQDYKRLDLGNNCTSLCTIPYTYPTPPGGLLYVGPWQYLILC